MYKFRICNLMAQILDKNLTNSEILSEEKMFKL